MNQGNKFDQECYAKYLAEKDNKTTEEDLEPCYNRNTPWSQLESIAKRMASQSCDDDNYEEVWRGILYNLEQDWLEDTRRLLANEPFGPKKIVVTFHFDGVEFEALEVECDMTPKERKSVAENWSQSDFFRVDIIDELLEKIATTN